MDNSHVRIILSIALVILCASILAISGCGPSQANAEPEVAPAASVMEWHWYQWFNEDGPYSGLIKWWTKEINDKSDGRFILVNHWQGKGSSNDSLTLLMSRTVDVSTVTPADFKELLPLSNVIHLPFCAPARVDWATAAAHELYKRNPYLV